MKFPESFKRDLRRNIEEAENITGMRVGMPRAHVDTSRLRYILAWIEKAEEALKDKPQ